MRMIIEKILIKKRNVYAAFMNFKKASDGGRMGSNSDVLKLYGVCGKLLDGEKVFTESAVYM